MEAALSGFAKTILGKFADRAIQEIQLAWYVKEDVKKLKDSLSSFEATLEAVEKGQYVITDPFRDWLGKLKEVFYDVDDVIDDFNTEALLRKMEETEETDCFMTKEVCKHFFSFSNPLIYILMMGHEIKGIRKTLGAIKDDKDNFHPTAQINSVMKVEDVQWDLDTHSFLRDPSGIIGREKDTEAIVQLLMESRHGHGHNNNNKDENVSVIPIVGMGGVGKTTLAKLVYNDERIENHFQKRIWAYIFDDCEGKTLMKKVIESIIGYKCADQSLETLQYIIRQVLDGKKYLLVLDDVWNENHHKWLRLKELLMGGDKGSKILVTTRSDSVASIMGTVSSHKLRGLSVDDCLRVFKVCAFKEGHHYQNLERIGKEIVRKCGGIPLAASALGSLLYGNTDESYWRFVQDNQMWELAEEKLNILPILKFSFNHLPSCMKRCFAYCSLFPKDYEIDREMLIQLWMAQGFIQSSNPNLCMEDIGNQYFNVLVSRSFFQDVVKDKYGNIIECKMHDLIHDLAQSVAENEYLTVDKTEIPSPRVRHISLLCKPYPELFIARKSRTFLNHVKLELSHDVSSCFKYLRVLDLCSSEIQNLSHSISELKHLRYLNLSFNPMIKILPKSINKLQNLQTLKLKDCRELEELPKHVGTMVSLRHIDLSGNTRIKTLPESLGELKNLQTLKLEGCKELRQLPNDIGKMVSLRYLEMDWEKESIYIPSGLGKLTCLRTLPLFIVEKEDISRSRPKLSVLHELNNLRGKLRIENLENAATSDAIDANLRKKRYIESLELKWNRRDGIDNGDFAFLEALQPHPNLKRLEIDGYEGASFPSWMMKRIGLSFPNLVIVNLFNCKRCQPLPQLGQISSLKVLHLENLEALEYIENYMVKEGGGGFFPSLENLYLFDMPKLKEWSRIAATTTGNDDGIIIATSMETVAQEQQQQQLLTLLSFPRLSKLTIDKCPELTTMPLHPSLEMLRIYDFGGKLLQSMMIVVAPENAREASSLSDSFHLGKLKDLSIKYLHGSVVLPEEGLRGLTSLQSLSFSNCDSLISLPRGMQYITTLEKLYIAECKDLTNLSVIRGLTSLRSLSIELCDSLIFLSPWMPCLTALEELVIKGCIRLDLLEEEDGLHGLESLQTLKISELPKLVFFPEGFQHAKKLQVLHISGCGGLMNLPESLGNFAHLKEILIEDCQNLQSLPQGMQHLTALENLKLARCPHLSRRYKRDIGEDWSKISRIRYVDIDEETEETI